MTHFPSFAPPSPRPASCRCPCNCGSFQAARMKLAAAQYAAALMDGSEIDGDFGGTDYEYIKDFAEFLPEALHVAGFRIGTRLWQGRVITVCTKRKGNQ